MSRFFTIIRRANSLLFLLILLGIFAILTVEFWPRIDTRDIQTIAAAPADPSAADERLEFGNAQLLTGTDTILVPLTAERDGMKIGSGSGYRDDTRNILAVRGDAKSNWIFHLRKYEGSKRWLAPQLLHERFVLWFLKKPVVRACPVVGLVPTTGLREL